MIQNWRIQPKFQWERWCQNALCKWWCGGLIACFWLTEHLLTSNLGHGQSSERRRRRGGASWANLAEAVECLKSFILLLLWFGLTWYGMSKIAGRSCSMGHDSQLIWLPYQWTWLRSGGVAFFTQIRTCVKKIFGQSSERRRRRGGASWANLAEAVECLKSFILLLLWFGLTWYGMSKIAGRSCSMGHDSQLIWLPYQWTWLRSGGVAFFTKIRTCVKKIFCYK